MSKKFYVAFSIQNFILPKLYMRRLFVDKLLAKNLNYEVRQFQFRRQAQIFVENKILQIKYLQMQKAKSKKDNLMQNQVLDIVQNKIRSEPIAIIQNKLPQNAQNIQKVQKVQKEFKCIFQKEKLKDIINDTQFQSIIEKHEFNFHPINQKYTIDLNMTYSGYFDGASRGNPGNASIGYYIDTDNMEQVLRYHQPVGKKTNNQAQYLALIFLLIDAYCNGIKKIKIYGDSQVIVNQVNQIYQINSHQLKIYCQIVKKLKKTFNTFEIAHIPRSLNKKADYICNLAFTQQAKKSYAKLIKEQNIKKKEQKAKETKYSIESSVNVQIKSVPLHEKQNIEEKIF